MANQLTLWFYWDTGSSQSSGVHNRLARGRWDWVAAWIRGEMKLDERQCMHKVPLPAFTHSLHSVSHQVHSMLRSLTVLKEFDSTLHHSLLGLTIPTICIRSSLIQNKIHPEDANYNNLSVRRGANTLEHTTLGR